MHSTHLDFLSYLVGYRSIISEANCGKFIDSDNMELVAKSIEEFSNMDKIRLNELSS